MFCDFIFYLKLLYLKALLRDSRFHSSAIENPQHNLPTQVNEFRYLFNLFLICSRCWVQWQELHSGARSCRDRLWRLKFSFFKFYLQSSASRWNDLFQWAESFFARIRRDIGGSSLNLFFWMNDFKNRFFQLYIRVFGSSKEESVRISARASISQSISSYFENRYSAVCPLTLIELL